MNFLKKTWFLVPLFSLFLAGCQTNPSSSSENLDTSDVEMNTYWNQAFTGINTYVYSFEEMTISPEFASASITKIVKMNDGELTKGYGYEATVRGFVTNIRFQIAIYDGVIVNFNLISHREHDSFGGRTLNALKTQLDDIEPVFSTIRTQMASSNGNRTGRSGTYDAVMDTIESITLHYSSQID